MHFGAKNVVDEIPVLGLTLVNTKACCASTFFKVIVALSRENECYVSSKSRPPCSFPNNYSEYSSLNILAWHGANLV